MRRRAGILAALLYFLVGAQVMASHFNVLRERAGRPTHRDFSHSRDCSDRTASASITSLPRMSDFRISLRQLLRKPIFTATAVLTLGIGMGVNAVAFSVVNGLLFKGYALSGIPDTGRILTTPGGDENGNASIAEYERFRDATANVLDTAAEGRSSLAWKHDGATETAWVLYVSRQY